MNQTSLEKIQAATPFLQWFRYLLPTPVQQQIRPYLDQPYQLALKILDACDATQGCALGTIATAADVSQNTARQVLNVLRDDEMVMVRETKQGLMFQEVLPERIGDQSVNTPTESAIDKLHQKAEFSALSKLSTSRS